MTASWSPSRWSCRMMAITSTGSRSLIVTWSLSCSWAACVGVSRMMRLFFFGLFDLVRLPIAVVVPSRCCCRSIAVLCLLRPGVQTCGKKTKQKVGPTFFFLHALRQTEARVGLATVTAFFLAGGKKSPHPAGALARGPIFFDKPAPFPKGCPPRITFLVCRFVGVHVLSDAQLVCVVPPPPSSQRAKRALCRLCMISQRHSSR
ncbi:hypothetical protein TW95_gp0740 [Pandoravirus inopinatum]|uniref:Uncharacterized protein n=1 Tax=Pandoravirus inopinatum TaxID=1605721 RepID=A0A0B5J1R1_9VIRU|nr:hypothetical protein TW95_gp0740 [Pandoravirus inopinatum]AJF97474.1 hypothetical protein [Pandoravirus inopinatum]